MIVHSLKGIADSRHENPPLLLYWLQIALKHGLSSPRFFWEALGAMLPSQFASRAEWALARLECFVIA
jgi:hypothetical protein